MKKKRNNQKFSRREAKERLTNWYMVNLGWGVAGLLVLTLIYRGYRSTGTILMMQPLMWVLTGVLAVAAVVVFVLGRKGVIKNGQRAKNYGIFLLVCALVGLWLALYNRVRPLLESAAQVILRRPELTVNSYWNVKIPMLGIAVYLAAAFIFYLVKVLRK